MLTPKQIRQARKFCSLSYMVYEMGTVRWHLGSTHWFAGHWWLWKVRPARTLSDLLRITMRTHKSNRWASFSKLVFGAIYWASERKRTEIKNVEWAGHYWSYMKEDAAQETKEQPDHRNKEVTHDGTKACPEQEDTFVELPLNAATLGDNTHFQSKTKHFSPFCAIS